MKKAALILTVMLLFTVTVTVNIQAQEITITGIVVSDMELVTEDGTTYYIVEGEVGDQLMMYIGKKIAATGNLEEVEGDKEITITHYQVFDETSEKALMKKTEEKVEGSNQALQ